MEAVKPMEFKGEIWDRKHDEAWEQAWIEYGKREHPAPVVITDDKPAQLALFEEEAS